MNSEHKTPLENDDQSAPDEVRNLVANDLSTRNLLGMSILSFLLYLGLALLLFYLFYENGLYSAFQYGYSVSIQLIVGILSGAAAAGVIMRISSRAPVSEVLDDFAIFKIISGAKFSTFDRIQISLFAGAGEELLFRGALQPLAGIWLTSLFFIAIHGYFKFKSAGHIFFGFMMFSLSMVLGWLFEIAGLLAAMTAHAVYDMVMLWWVRKVAK